MHKTYTIAAEIKKGDQLVAFGPTSEKFCITASGEYPVVWAVERFKGNGHSKRTIVYLSESFSFHMESACNVCVIRPKSKPDVMKALDGAFRSFTCGTARTREEFMKTCRR